MADNIDVTPGTGKTVAADDIGGILHQRVKISQGADGSGTDVSSAAPLQVTLANTGANTNKLLVTPDSVALPANQSVNVSQINAVTPLMGNGVTGTGSPRVTIASDNTAFSVNSVQSGTWTVQPGNTANTTAWKVDASSVAVPVTDNSGSLTIDGSVSLIPTTSGGLVLSSTLIASGTNATSVKASAGQLYNVQIFNNSANIAYLKLYNTAGTPTAGSGTPVLRILVPGNSSGTGSVTSTPNGIAFGTGIGFTFTGGIADNDTTSVAASSYILNLLYK